MLDSYLPILTLIFIAICFSVGASIFSRLVGENKPSAVKLAAYECGMPPVGSAHAKFSIKFYIIAMLFIVFDIEVVFMYPWAVMFKRLGLFGFALAAGLFAQFFVYAQNFGSLYALAEQIS